jgi:hemerythrin-like domain-containing protein
MKSTALLLEDHKHILRALRVLEEMAALVKRGNKKNDKDVQDVLEFLNGFADRIHQGREESILFPALLRDPGQKNYKELSGLIFEHNRQRSLIEGLHDSIASKEPKDFVYYATRFVEILRHHIQEEEQTLFPLSNSTLSPAEDERIAEGMQNEDRVWQDQNVARLLHQLDYLESKYTAKTPTGLHRMVAL